MVKIHISPVLTPIFATMTDGRIILINKPYDWTSFDAVKYVRKVLRGEKIGHAGTLDPLATGLLVLCTGKMTKRITEIQDAEKEYTGSFTLGATTASFDRETKPSDEKNISHVTAEVIVAAVKNFVGEIMQTPPQHSAAKINGQRAYALARKGKDVDLKPRKVIIHEFEIVKVELPEVFFRIVCSKGTYIRSLANDVGEKLGCGAFLSSLCRTRIGSFLLKDAVEPRLFAPQVDEKEEII